MDEFQQFSFVFANSTHDISCAAQFNLLHFRFTPIRSTSPPVSTGRERRSDHHHLTAYFFLSQSLRYPRIHLHRRYPHEQTRALSPPHIPIELGDISAATVLFTPSLGRIRRLEGCILGRGGATMLRAIVSATSRGI